MFDVRDVPLWVWGAAVVGGALVYKTRATGRVAASVSLRDQIYAQAGGPPAPYRLPPEYTHSCPIEWTGRFGWSPNVTGEWLLYGDC